MQPLFYNYTISFVCVWGEGVDHFEGESCYDAAAAVAVGSYPTVHLRLCSLRSCPLLCRMNWLPLRTAAEQAGHSGRYCLQQATLFYTCQP